MNNANDPSMNSDGTKSGLPAIFKNKIFLIGGGLVLVLIVVLLVIGPSSKKAAVDPSADTLVIWGFEDPTSFDEIIANFQDINPGQKVTYTKKDPATYATDSLNEIAAGKGPDIWSIPNTWLPKYHDKLLPMPTDLIADKKTKKNDIETYKTLFPNVVVSDNIIDNNIYGMPLSIDTLVLYYNPAILTETMVAYNKAHEDSDNTAIDQIFIQGPKNWDDFVTITKLITAKTGADITQSAVALGTPDNINQSADILTLLMMQDGAKMTSDDLSTAQFHTKQNVFGGQDFPGAQALNFYAAFANPKNDLYTWNNSFSDSVRAFTEGRTAMMIDYASAKTDIKRLNPKFEYDFFAVPQVKETKNPINYASYVNYTVTKASKKSDLAWQFITGMANSTTTNSYLAKTGGQSAQMTNLVDNADIPATQVLTAQGWYVPDPEKTPQIFEGTIKQVNDGKVIQTAIEYAGSQITTLLGKLKQ